MTSFTPNVRSSAAFLRILDLSADRLVFPFSPSLLTGASLCQPIVPISTLIAKASVYFQAGYFHPQAVLAPQDSLLVLHIALEIAESQNRGEIDIINYIKPKMVYDCNVV